MWYINICKSIRSDKKYFCGTYMVNPSETAKDVSPMKSTSPFTMYTHTAVIALSES